MWLEGPKAIAPTAEELGTTAPLAGFQAGLEQIISSGEGAEKGRQSRSIVEIAAFRQGLGDRMGKAETGPTEAAERPPSGIPDVSVGEGDFRLDLLIGVEMQPRLVMKRMVADFMAGIGDGLKDGGIVWESRVLADDKERDAKRAVIEDRKSVV